MTDLPPVVSNILQHPEYLRFGGTGRSLINDFAILKLATPVKRSSKPFFVCLPKDNHDQYAGANITISGWGKTSPHALNGSAVLKSAFVRAMSDSECFESVKKLFNRKDDQLSQCFPKSFLVPKSFYFGPLGKPTHIALKKVLKSLIKSYFSIKLKVFQKNSN